MKISLALGPRQPLSPQTAWGCLTTNVALPGFGSLVAGRPSGYLQAALAFGGLGVSLIFGLRFAAWSISHWSELQGETSDPLERLMTLWAASRWALLGIAIFAAGWLWGLLTGLAIVRQARNTPPQPSSEPPRLTP